MIRLRNCRRRRKQRSVIERLASKLWVPKLWLPMSPGYPCCCEDETCDGCSDTVPGSMQVVIDALADSEHCSLCNETWNDTLILDDFWDAGDCTGTAHAEHCCVWSYEMPSTVCAADYVNLGITIWPDGDTLKYRFDLSASPYRNHPAQDPNSLWRITESSWRTSKIDCPNVSNVLLDSGSAVGYLICDDTSATAYVTAL